MTHIHGGNIKQAADKYSLNYRDIIDFSANINFLGPPASVKELMKKEPDIITRYPQPQAKALKKELADHINLEPENIIIGNGAVEIIYQLLRIIQPGVTLIPAPSFSEYAYAVRSIDKEVKRIELRENKSFSLDVNDFIAYLKEVDMAFLCNPHNPTGKLLKNTEIMRILKAADAEDVWLLIDEAFIDFIASSRNYSMIKNMKNYRKLFIIRSLTKFFAIPGLRLGYGIGGQEIIKEMEMKRDPWSVNILAQQAGKLAVRDEPYIRKTKKANDRERAYLYKHLKKIKALQPFEPAANFIFIKIKQKYSAGELKDKAAGKGILIRDCSSYDGLSSEYIRVAVKSREDNDKLLAVFSELFKDYS